MAAMAARFVNSTSKNIFLTGKAGTGKTTFLRQLSESTHKRHVILAPTGIAALNANGVTIHSQFLLPFGTFLPDRNLPDELPEGVNFYTQSSLIRRHPLNEKRRDVLRNLDLLIIDEVSMLRADLLDAIDARMRRVKRNYGMPFGGVQLLMIGDMYQLPPVVKDQEWNKMSQYYASPHFFESVGLKQSGFVYIELDKIFRQQDDHFISILNNLRNNIVTQTDIDVLNSHFKEASEDTEDVITITTHNYRADELNRKALDRLEEQTYYFEAEVADDFPKNLFPVAESLELKKGAQVMFVKNDSENGDYFNGKLAKVVAINSEGIEVIMDDSDEPYSLKREKWENKKYTVRSSSKELDEEVVGTFSQYPVKLAWAITVHKSQGLTFEKAIIDVGKAFAPGQVYVALSRLTSLDGLILRTRIDPSVVSTDNQVVTFSQRKDRQDDLSVILKNDQANYLRSLLTSTFDLNDLLKVIGKVREKHESEKAGQFEDEEMRGALAKLADDILAEVGNTEKFKQQLQHYLFHSENEKLLDRISKGSEYYIKFVEARLRDLIKHTKEVEQFTKTKTYATALGEIDLVLTKKWEQMDKAHHIAQCILTGKEVTPRPEQDTERRLQRMAVTKEVSKFVEEHPKNTKTKSGRTRKRKPGEPKPEPGATYLETFKMVNDGLSIGEISEKRGLKPSTLESHFSRGLKEGAISISKLMDATDVEVISNSFSDNPGAPMGAIYGKLNGKYSYGQIRMVQAHLAAQKN